MKLNRGGLKLCGVYVAFSIALIALAATATEPQYLVALVFLPTLWFLRWMDSIPESWRIIVPFVLFPLNLLIVYLVGWAFSLIINVKDPSLSAADDPPDWHRR